MKTVTTVLNNIANNKLKVGFFPDWFCDYSCFCFVLNKKIKKWLFEVCSYNEKQTKPRALVQNQRRKGVETEQ